MFFARALLEQSLGSAVPLEPKCPPPMRFAHPQPHKYDHHNVLKPPTSTTKEKAPTGTNTAQAHSAKLHVQARLARANRTPDKHQNNKECKRMRLRQRRFGN
eukprot:8539417-Alexandrium_andersonii.AAC.1